MTFAVVCVAVVVVRIAAVVSAAVVAEKVVVSAEVVVAFVVVVVCAEAVVVTVVVSSVSVAESVRDSVSGGLCRIGSLQPAAVRIHAVSRQRIIRFMIVPLSDLAAFHIEALVGSVSH